MRRLAIMIIFAGLLSPSAAFAGMTHTSFTSSQENGVTVYRGQASKHNFQMIAAQQERHMLRAEQNKIKSRLSIQERKLAAQQRSIDMLQAQNTQNSAAAKPKRRARYGRSYVGNNRFFGRNGFIGNSNFSGATQALPRKRRSKRRNRH